MRLGPDTVIGKDVRPMGALDTLRDIGGAAGGILIYNAAKAAARMANMGQRIRKLKPQTVCRLKHLFPQLDMGRVRFVIKASLPRNWFASPDKVSAMTFGYKIYFKGSNIQKTDAGLKLLIHELVHVDQVRRRGNDETKFACDYGKGYLSAGNYRDNPLEDEAFVFVDTHKVPAPCLRA